MEDEKPILEYASPRKEPPAKLQNLVQILTATGLFIFGTLVTFIGMLIIFYWMDREQFNLTGLALFVIGCITISFSYVWLSKLRLYTENI